MKKFAVVEFVDEKAVDVVPETWIEKRDRVIDYIKCYSLIYLVCMSSMILNVFFRCIIVIILEVMLLHVYEEKKRLTRNAGLLMK